MFDGSPAARIARLADGDGFVVVGEATRGQQRDYHVEIYTVSLSLSQTNHVNEREEDFAAEWQRAHCRQIQSFALIRISRNLGALVFDDGWNYIQNRITTFASANLLTVALKHEEHEVVRVLS